MRIAYILSFLTLAACDRGNCDGAECANDTGDCLLCHDDTGVTEKKGKLIVRPTWLGQPLPCTVNAAGPVDQSWDVGASPEPMQLPVGQYALGVGSGNYGGVTGHSLPDGQVLVSRVVDAEVEVEAETSASLPLAAYFDGEFECTTQYWSYSEEAPDHKGAAGNTYTDPKHRKQVVQGYKLNTFNDEQFNGFLQEGSLEVDATKGNAFLYLNADNPNGWYLQASKIEKNAFEIELVRPNSKVALTRCVK